MVTVTTLITLDVADTHSTQGDDGFPNALIAQIGKVINNLIYKSGDFLKLVFSDNSSITASLKAVDYMGAEALYILCKNNEWGVL